jgi:hypothetical protein
MTTVAHAKTSSKAMPTPEHTQTPGAAAAHQARPAGNSGARQDELESNANTRAHADAWCRCSTPGAPCGHRAPTVQQHGHSSRSALYSRICPGDYDSTLNKIAQRIDEKGGETTRKKVNCAQDLPTHAAASNAALKRVASVFNTAFRYQKSHKGT